MVRATASPGRCRAPNSSSTAPCPRISPARPPPPSWSPAGRASPPAEARNSTFSPILAATPSLPRPFRIIAWPSALRATGSIVARIKILSAYDDFLGKTETRTDRADPRLIEGFAATLGIDTPQAEMPPLWHWMLFQDWKRPDGIGPDGHPKRGGFLPPVHHLPRRMWAGGRLRFFEAGIRADETVTRISTIKAISQKSGGSGDLVFVTVAHSIEGPRGPVLEEEHDIV
ncbi:MAG: hypothetical protein EBY30_12345, partial [Rhodospirillales bacterium]|nr:hypothetical protein [Rhodospirillales bacterium]